MATGPNQLNPSTWECQYHIGFTLKYRKKILYMMLRQDLTEVLHWVAQQKEWAIEQDSLIPDHTRFREEPFIEVLRVEDLFFGQSPHD